MLGSEHSRLLAGEEETSKSRTPLRYALRFAAAAAALAVVATVGIAVVHPNGRFAASALGQAAPGSGLAGGFAQIVTRTRTSDAMVIQEQSDVEFVSAAETYKNEVRALAAAGVKLTEATAESEKAQLLLKQAEITAQQAKADVLASQADATQGSRAIASEKTAIEETAELSEEKRSYLATRNTYAASTQQVAQLKTQLQMARNATADAYADYTARKAAAGEARALADKMAVQMEEHRMQTRSVALVGEESIQEGVSRSQVMAQVAAAATQQEILSGDLVMQSAVLKAAWDARLLTQKTAQETLDAEVARNHQLAEESNKAQREFIDQSHVAAIDATAAANARLKAEQALAQASRKLAAATSALEWAKKEANRFGDVAEVRRQENSAQRARTEAAKGKADVQAALYEVAQSAVDLEMTKEDVNRDALVNTITSKMKAAQDDVADAKEAENLKKTNTAANDITQSAIHPLWGQKVVQNEAVQDAAPARLQPQHEAEVAADAAGPESAAGPEAAADADAAQPQE